ncbi:MAG: recombination protein NinG [Thermodesulfobacteriota bacterium]
MKKCAVCREEFTQFNSLGKVCSPKCALALVEKDKAKRWRKKKLQYRKDNKKISEWIKEAQVSINTYVRLRDHDKPCISCNGYRTDNNLTGSNWHAGHYRSTGSAPHLRFNLINIRKQCAHCNNYLSGNIVEYRKNLLQLIGPEKLEALETNNAYRKFTREYCERVKRIFNKKARILNKRLGI